MFHKIVLLGVTAGTLILSFSSPANSAGLSSPQMSSLVEKVGKSIPHLSIVSPELIRGGQPNVYELKQLKDLGVRTIVNLRLKGADESNERAEATSLGLNYVNLPMGLSKPVSDEYVEEFISIVRDPKMQPVFLHCKLGSDRTGTMVAIYRMREQGWTSAQCYDEMLKFGFHPIFRKLSKSVFSLRAKSGMVEPIAERQANRPPISADYLP